MCIRPADLDYSKGLTYFAKTTAKAKSNYPIITFILPQRITLIKPTESRPQELDSPGWSPMGDKPQGEKLVDQIQHGVLASLWGS